MTQWIPAWKSAPEIRSGRRAKALLACALLAVAGCTSPIVRPQSPASGPEEKQPQFIGAMTNVRGLDYIQIEAVSLVTQLNGTGGDPEPSPQRAELLKRMGQHDVATPAKVLASPNTAMVVTRAYLRPGIQKGDRFDVEVRAASRSQAASLRNGWLMPTRMTQMAVLAGAIREGHPLAQATGPVLVDDPTATDDDSSGLIVGRVLGGGVAWESRPLELVLDSKFANSTVSPRIGKAINDRFFAFRQGEMQGVATPKTDLYIEIAVHPRYKDNVARYMRVISNIAYQESPAERQGRLVLLERQLLDPVTSATAALRLEAIGEEAIEVLKRGVVSDDPEVRFFSAEALAYLDDTEAVTYLANAARDEPAFRIHALTALSAMNDPIAYDALRDLLSEPSAETRYGAFRSLWAMDEKDPFIRGEQLGGQFGYHVLDIEGPPLIHVARSFRPEIVLFGVDQYFKTPLVLDAGKYIMVHSSNSNSAITVSRFAPGEPTQQRQVGVSVNEVIRAIVELGGTYPDVVQALAQASAQDALSGRFRIDALPENGRNYERTRETVQSDSPAVEPPKSRFDVPGPIPELFFFRKNEATASDN